MSPYSVQNTIFWQCMSGQAVVQGGGRCKDFWSQSDSGALSLVRADLDSHRPLAQNPWMQTGTLEAAASAGQVLSLQLPELPCSPQKFKSGFQRHMSATHDQCSQQVTHVKPVVLSANPPLYDGLLALHDLCEDA